MLQSRREAGKWKCRLSILAASKRLFKEYGYENTMIEDVAREANVSKATIYNYFTNKESLLAGTMEAEIENLSSFIKELDESLNGYEKIKTTLIHQILESRSYIDIGRRLVLLNACEDSPMYRKSDVLLEMFIDMAEQAKEEGVFKKEISTELIVALINGVYLCAQFGWRDLEEIGEQQCSERMAERLDLALAGCLVK